MPSFVKLKQQLVFITAGMREEQNLLYVCLLFTMAKVNSKEFEAHCHVRCLSRRNPFESNNEVLVTILEEMKRWWEGGQRRVILIMKGECGGSLEEVQLGRG